LSRLRSRLLFLEDLDLWRRPGEREGERRRGDRLRRREGEGDRRRRGGVRERDRL